MRGGEAAHAPCPWTFPCAGCEDAHRHSHAWGGSRGGLGEEVLFMDGWRVMVKMESPSTQAGTWRAPKPRQG